ncbi:hypothetical protein GCM10018783_68530 [Streptomyces griseosporeus]|nr:hypothetical protein GCM10018783_68530 [Streptomyces griseosporeus]
MVKNVARPPRISRPRVDPRSEILKYLSNMVDNSSAPGAFRLDRVGMLAGLFPHRTRFRCSPCYGSGT